jgi:hypothetical protein
LWDDIDGTFPLVHIVPVARETSGEVEIVAGVVGPELITFDGPDLVLLTPDGAIEFSITIRFDRELRRYVCSELRAREITTELLRHVKIADWIKIALAGDPGRSPIIRELPNPDGREPWGHTARTKGASKQRPTTERALAWVAHFYRYGLALDSPTKAVEEGLMLPRSTASRWVSYAREAGYLGPSEGPGKAGG